MLQEFISDQLYLVVGVNIQLLSQFIGILHPTERFSNNIIVVCVETNK